MGRITGWDFWRFCFRLGMRESVRGLDYFRFYEYPSFYSALEISRACRVLDLGCGRGLFPLYCAVKHPGIRYTTVDIDQSAVDWQRRTAKRLGGLPNLEVCHGDSRRLDFTEETFDRVANLGSIEHIPGDGDIQTATEMGRVCQSGGKLLFSIPYSFVGSEQPSCSHWKGFERRYDDRSIQERLVNPSGCLLESVTYFGEAGFKFSRYWYPVPFALKLPFRHFAPYASRKWLGEMPAKDRGNACGVRIVLRKGG